MQPDTRKDSDYKAIPHDNATMKNYYQVGS